MERTSKRKSVTEKEFRMKFTESNWNKWLSKVENAWFYLRNPSLLVMTFERVEVTVNNVEDTYDYDLEA